jgi:hypothetical protein
MVESPKRISGLGAVCWFAQSEKNIGMKDDWSISEMAFLRRGHVLAIVVILVVSAASLLYIYQSSEYSWDSSIRDIDGDGVTDSDDLYPSDPMLWGRASATVVVTIVNDYGRDLSYFFVGVDGTGYIGMFFNQIDNGQSAVETLVYSWDVGQTPPSQGVATVRAYSNGTLVADIEQKFDLMADATIPVSMWIGKPN